MILFKNLDRTFDNHTGKKERGQDDTDSGDPLEEEVSEVEYNTEYDPGNHKTTNEKKVMRGALLSL